MAQRKILETFSEKVDEKIATFSNDIIEDDGST